MEGRLLSHGQPGLMLYPNGENNPPTLSQTTGFLPAGGTRGEGLTGDRRFCASTFGPLLKRLESGNASGGTRFVIHTRLC